MEAVTNWLKHDWEHRKDHTKSLLEKVRLGVIQSTKLMDYMTEDMMALPECRELIESVVSRQQPCDDAKPSALVDWQLMFRPRGITVSIIS